MVLLFNAKTTVCSLKLALKHTSPHLLVIDDLSIKAGSSHALPLINALYHRLKLFDKWSDVITAVQCQAACEEGQSFSEGL